MIKKFIHKLLGKSSSEGLNTKKQNFGKRIEVPYSAHKINPELVDKRAMDVVKTLKDAGFEAYVVGGAVRDLLVGLKPKDFDVATNATPEQVKSLFRRAFIIGRRFRIVHVVYGRGRENEVIEVSTFRAFLDNAAAEQVPGNERTSKRELAGVTHAVDSTGRVLRDNVWGPQEEDAVRRDFTINAMYYDPQRQIVVDYHGGMQDVKKLSLRMIGDAALRYREDPVRIIRAVRFAAKLSGLGFTLDSKTAKPLVESQILLADVPQSRLFDEMLKLLQTGHALATIEQLKKLGLARGIYPLLDVIVERAQLPFVQAALQDTDRRVGEGKPVAASFLLAAVLWDDVNKIWHTKQKNQASFPALQDAIDEVFHARIGDVSGRGKLAADMREIWTMQSRFEKRVGAAPYSLVDQLRFRAGFDFMCLRADIGEVDEALVGWWQEFSNADDQLRADLVDQARLEIQKARAVARKVPGANTLASPQQDAAGLGAEAKPAAKKPRRRAKPKNTSAETASVKAGLPNGETLQSSEPSYAIETESSRQETPNNEGLNAPAKRRRRRKSNTKPAASGTQVPDAGEG